ncbi:MAG: hypothetical protein FWD40_07600 [Treponema sp.]|nr:hypothetical protein [Treponema sp.]
MKKPLAYKIIGLAVIYCFVFCLLVILQFSNQGTFSLPAGGMTIRGRLADKVSDNEKAQGITGGIRIFYGGLDFNLKEERGRGLILAGDNGSTTAANPEYMILSENIARFILPGGTIITFNSMDSVRGMELQISAEFADNISSITIPIIPRRSSLLHDSGQLGIMYGGSRYVLSSLGQELETGNMILSRENPSIAYRSRGRQRAFDPAEFIIAREQNYSNVLASWLDSSFAGWNQNTASLQSEYDIMAYLSQSLQRGNYSTAIRNVPGNFNNSPEHSFRSSAFTGGMTNAYRTFTSSENERMNQITRLIRARSLDILKEEHVIDYLFTRNNSVLANDIIELAANASPDMIIYDYIPGLLEFFQDVRYWRPASAHAIDHLTDQIINLISENLNRDTENDAIYVTSTESNTSEYSFRLGKALAYWAEATHNTEWAAIGRSLILSAISTGNAGRLYGILKPSDYYPKAVWLTANGHWAWTVSPLIRVTTEAGGNLNLAVSFPANMSHHLIIRGVRPFNRIQIHGMDWRTDSQFESYDSSGWVYYPDNQTLILKLRHRTVVENVRLIYQAAAPAPSPSPSPPPPVIESSEVNVE